MVEKTLRGICIAGIFILPFLVLYVANSLFFPFITGKNFAFRIIVEIITGAWLALALVNPAYRPYRSWLLGAFSFFILWMAVANAFGVYPSKSFWSNYERMEGWVTLLHLLAFFVVAQSVLTTERLWKYWWHTSLSVSLVVAGIGVMQLLGLENINQGQERIDARIGNATYLGVYMLFHIFMAAMMFAREWVEGVVGITKRFAYSIAALVNLSIALVIFSNYRKLLDVPPRIWLALLSITVLLWLFARMRTSRLSFALSALAVVMALDTFILFFSATRGAILGLIGGFALSALILILLAPRSRVAWRAGVVIGALIIVAGAFWTVKDQAWVHEIEPLHRLAAIADEGFPLARQLNIEMAIQGFKERPIFGWGQENYAAVFDKYYNPRMYAQEAWFDRTHSILFDWLIAGGLFGLIGYVALYVFALGMVWRSSVFPPYERALLSGLFAGYFFYLFFTFDNITSYILFVALLSYITVRAYTGTNTSAPLELLPRSALPFTAAFAIVLVWGTVWYVNADMLSANRMLIRAISPQAGGAAQNQALFEEALTFSPAGTQEIREQFSQAAISIVAAPNISLDVKQKFVQAAAQSLNVQVEEAPYNARAPFFLGILLDRAGAYAEAQAVLTEARKRSPQKQAILFELGLNAFARGANDEALAFFTESYNLEPSYVQAKMYYAMALIRTGRGAQADTLVQEVLTQEPNNTEHYLSFASAYAATGNAARAIEILEMLKKISPQSAAQVDAFIEQVRSGIVQ